MNNIKIWK